MSSSDRGDHHRRLSALLGAVAALAAAGASPAAAAPPLACGTTIVADTMLRADLVGCAGDGLVMAADGITLDLNGHAIRGDESPGATEADVGIRVDGRRRVTIRNGTVRGFDLGVLLTGSTSSVIRSVVARDNALFGISLEDSSDGNRVERSTAFGNGSAGITFFGSGDEVIAHNVVRDNAVSGMGGVATSGNRIVGNVSSGNGSDGLFLVFGSHDNRVSANVLTRNGEVAVVTEGDRNALVSNHMVHNGAGVILDGNDNRTAGNLIVDSFGCADGCGIGISLEGGARNRISSNHVAGTTAQGIRADGYGGLVSDTVIEGNVVVGAGTDAFGIGLDHAGPVERTELIGNTAIGASDDGFGIEALPTTLTRNAARRNGDLGIDAPVGVTDGGGNRASGNGNAAQCTNVACG